MPENISETDEKDIDVDEKGEDEEEEAIPDYVFPLFFTSKTQEIFGCKADEDVTTENPHILINKERILQDYKDRAAISDFHPAKSIVQEYPHDEFLVVYDPLFKYGQNFFLVITEEGKEAILNPPVPIEEEETRSRTVTPRYVVKSPTPWVSLGSEPEIANENVVNERERVSFTIMRKRRGFGIPIFFTDRNATDAKSGSIDCPGYEDFGYDLKKAELDKGIQNVAVCEEGSSQTEWPRPKNANVQYEARTLPSAQLEEIVKSQDIGDFLKQVVDRFELALQHNETIDIFTDDYNALSEEDINFGSKSDNHLKEYQSFTDLKFSKNKAIKKIQWHPTVRGLVAVSCAEQMSFDERIDNYSKVLMNPSFILLWSFADPIHPLLLMEAPDDILCFEFNPSDPNVIAGGCINGQIVIWDISQYSERIANHRSQVQGHSKHTRTALPSFLNPNKTDLSPIVRYCAVSNIEHSHKMAITDIKWIPDHFEVIRMGNVIENKAFTCCQLMSCASDGQILFWDTRPSKTTAPSQTQMNAPSGASLQFKHLDLTWKPILKVMVRQVKGSSDLSAIRFSISDRQGERGDAVKPKRDESIDEKSYDRRSSMGMGIGRKKEEGKILENINTKFYVATEDGELVYMDWKLSKDIDTGKVVSPRPELLINAHDGAINTLERSPFFKDIILTVGGWTFAIWRENVIRGPLLMSSSHAMRLTAAHWSPSRPAVFYIGKADGSVDVWDLLDKTHEPFLNQSVTPVPIQTIFPYQISSRQQLLAIGDKIGTLHIFEVPWNLRQPSTNEVTSVENYFDRETRRLSFLEEREQKSLKEKDERVHLVPDVKIFEDESEWEQRARMVYQEYLDLERRILEELGVKTETEEIEVT